MLLIYIPATSPRIKYVFELLFRHELGIDYRTTSDAVEFMNYEAEKLTYSTSRNINEFFIKASPLLFENDIRKREIHVEEKYDVKVLFSNNESCDVGFDIFSAIFYMVSRYEEYLPFEPDRFGRYPATDGLAFKNNFLQTPVVNVWIGLFKKILKTRFPSLKIKSAAFKAIVTYDVDVAYKYKGRNFYRALGSTAKDLLKLSWKNIFQRIMVLMKKQKDPWDVYEALAKTIKQHQLPSIFFFLLGDKSPNDRNLDYKSRLMTNLVRKVMSFSEIGIHPSFYTSALPEKIVIEKGRLEKISGKKIVKSRQHFLKFNLPDTYNSLLAAGITEDYSMVFPAQAGFRAGTCRPFYFYDLKNEKATPLKIFPVTFMEGTFINNKPGFAFALQQIIYLMNEVRKVNGTFISIWHNHTVSETKEYKEWKNIHDQMIRALL